MDDGGSIIISEKQAEMQFLEQLQPWGAVLSGQDEVCCRLPVQTSSCTGLSNDISCNDGYSPGALSFGGRARGVLRTPGLLFAPDLQSCSRGWNRSVNQGSEVMDAKSAPRTICVFFRTHVWCLCAQVSPNDWRRQQGWGTRLTPSEIGAAAQQVGRRRHGSPLPLPDTREKVLEALSGSQELSGECCQGALDRAGILCRRICAIVVSSRRSRSFWTTICAWRTCASTCVTYYGSMRRCSASRPSAARRRPA